MSQNGMQDMAEWQRMRVRGREYIAHPPPQSCGCPIDFVRCHDSPCCNLCGYVCKGMATGRFISQVGDVVAASGQRAPFCSG